MKMCRRRRRKEFAAVYLLKALSCPKEEHKKNPHLFNNMKQKWMTVHPTLPALRKVNSIGHWRQIIKTFQRGFERTQSQCVS